MFFQYPYTDMYALNLDWMIKAIKEVQEIIENLGHVVNTVNGLDGDVTISADMVNATSINSVAMLGTGVIFENITKAQLQSLYDNGVRLLMSRNNLGVFDRAYFLTGTYAGDVQAFAYDPTGELSGVVSLNGLSGALMVNGANLPISEEDSTTIKTLIDHLDANKLDSVFLAGNTLYKSYDSGTALQIISIDTQATADSENLIYSGAVVDAIDANNVIINQKLNPTAATPGQFFQINSQGQSEWGPAASDTAVANAVTAWLGENVPTGTTVVIDRSLTVSDAAADAAVTGTKISYVKDAVFESVNASLPITVGGADKYVGTDGALHNNAGVSSYTNYFDVVPGAVVTLNGVYLAGVSRACCVYDADGNNPEVVAVNTNETTITFTVPAGKYKCRTTIAYGGTITGTIVYDINRIAEIEDDISIVGNDPLDTSSQTLTGAVNELNAAITPLENVPAEIAVIQAQFKRATTPLFLSVTRDSRALKSNGYSVIDELSEIKIYHVTPGALIHVKVSADTPGVFQFQTHNVIPSAGTQNIVGTTYTSAFDDYITVPDSALYLCVSQLKTNVTNAQTNAEYIIPTIETDVQSLGEVPIYAGAISKTNDIVVPKMISWDERYVLDAITDGTTTKKKVQGICSDEKRYLFWAALGSHSQPSFVSKWDTALNKRAAVNLDPGLSYGHCNDIAFIPADFTGLDNGSVDRLYIVGLGQSYSGDATYPIFVVNANTLEYITKFSTSTLLNIDGFAGVRSVTSSIQRGKIVVASYCTAGSALLIYDADGTLEKYCTYTGTLGGGLHCDNNFIYVNSASTGNDGNIDVFDWDLNPITRGHFKDYEYEFEGIAQIGEVMFGSWNQEDSERDGLVITKGRVSRNYFFKSDSTFPQNASVSNVHVYIV